MKNNRCDLIGSGSSTCCPTGEHVPLTGPSHDQMVCTDGLPGLPGAHQDSGRPTSNNMPGRFAPARRPDRSRGDPGATWVVTPSVEGQLRRDSPAVTPSKCLPEGMNTSDGVCPKAVTRRGSLRDFLKLSRPRSVCPRAVTPLVVYARRQ